MQDASVDLWATDEVHVQPHGSRCRMWIPPEIKDPVLLHAPTRKSVGYFGAVHLRDGRFVFRLETGKFNGPSFFQFLQQLRPTSRGTGRRVVVITDNAPYHHSRLHLPWRDKHAVEHDSEGEQIGARIQFFTQRLLRAHVGNRAQRRAGGSQVVDADSDRGTGSSSRCIQDLAHRPR
jgi:hypothetical protein